MNVVPYRLLTLATSNRRRDNKLNVLEGIHRNPLFIIVTLFVIGVQIAIVLIGGDVFKTTRLDAREWGVSVGLGLLPLPLGVLIRLIPDTWVALCLPWFIRKKWAPETISEELMKRHQTEQVPLRFMSLVRGSQAQDSVGFRAWASRTKSKKSKPNEKAAPVEKKNKVVMTTVIVDNKPMRVVDPAQYSLPSI